MPLLRVIAPLLTMLFEAQTGLSQNPNPNLVPNPSFEEWVFCPDQDGEFAGCDIWFNPSLNNIATPDYFNGCNTEICGHSVPSNAIGPNEYAHDGYAYAGIFNFKITYESYREYVAVELLNELQPDSLYEGFFWTKRASAADKAAPVGFNFWQNQPIQQNTIENNCWDFEPNGVQSEPIIDTSWQAIHFYYVAQGGESYISIGNGLDDESTETFQALHLPSPCQTNPYGEGYVLIDDVSVQLYPLPYVVDADTTICSGEMATLHAYGYQFEGWALASDPETIISTDEILEVYPTEDITYRALFGQNYQDVTLHIVGYPGLDLGPDQSICAGDTVVFDVTQPGASYRWQDDSYASVYSAFQENNYVLKLTSEDGCSVYDTVFVEVSEFMNLGFDIKDCVGDTTLVDYEFVDGYDYIWSTGDTTETIEVTQDGWVWLESTFGNCIYRDSLYVHQDPYSTVTLGPDTTLCDLQFLYYDFTDLADYTIWYDNPDGIGGDWSDTYLINEAGTYVAYINLGYCTTVETINVSYFPSDIVDLPGDQTLCEGGVLYLSVPAHNYDQVWQDGSTGFSFIVTEPGDYWTIVSYNDCISTDEITVSYQAYPVVDLGSDTLICEGTTLTLDAGNPGFNYIWQNNTGGQFQQVTEPGNYWVTVYQSTCSATDEITIDFYPQNSLSSLGDDDVICDGESSTLSIENDWTTFLWSTGETTPEITVDTSGVYWVTVEDICSVQSDTIVLAKEYCNCSIYLPYVLNTGTLGANEVNTTQFSCPVTDFSLKIFDPIGKLMAETNDIDWYWRPGPRTAFGVYVFVISYRFEHESEMRYLTQKVLVAERIRN